MVMNAIRIRKILALREGGLSERSIAAKLEVGKGSVQRILHKADAMNITTVEAGALDDKKLVYVFFPVTAKGRRTKEVPDFKEIHDRISHTKHRSVMHEWYDYRKVNPDGYSYARFCQLYDEWCHEFKVHPKLLTNEVPGQSMYIDWAGDTITCQFDDEDKPVTIYFFVTSLGASELPYVEPFEGQSVSEYCQGVVDALDYYGGIPKYVVPDNTRTAVIRNRDQEFELQQTFEEMENYYGYTVLPARPLSPTDKNDAESNVHSSEDYIISDLMLDEVRFKSFSEVQAACTMKLNELVMHKFRHTDYNRLQWFKKVDFPYLMPHKKDFIPYSHEFETVPASYHVHLKHDPHQYSVPYQYIGHDVILKYSFTELIVEDKASGNVIAKWPRFYGTRLDTTHTLDAHRPPNHQIAVALKIKDGTWYLEQAARIGPWTHKAVQIMLDRHKDHPEAIYRACMAVVSSAWNGNKHKCTYGELEQACRSAIEMKSVHWKNIKACLQVQKEEKRESSYESRTHLPSHSNIRDGSIYK